MSPLKNKYYGRSHISERKFRVFLQCFSYDLTAYDASHLTVISHRSCKVIYAKLRVHIAKFCVNNGQQYVEFELDEIYFGAAFGENGGVVLLERRLYSGC